MASVFPEHFAAIYNRLEQGPDDLIRLEERILGTNHAELGGLYLQNYNLPEVMVETARFHHHPERASSHAQVVAAVEIADLLVRHARIGTSGNPVEVSNEDWMNATGWGILFPRKEDSEQAIAHANLKRSLERLPTILEGLV
jgi:HD-like signal output (HDOD) protein